jgi:hypothetical protein
MDGLNMERTVRQGVMGQRHVYEDKSWSISDLREILGLRLFYGCRKWSRRILSFISRLLSLPCSQELTTGSYSETEKFIYLETLSLAQTM